MRFLLTLLLTTASAFAQVTPVAQMPHAYKICDEGCTITSMPVGTIFQFGSGTGATWLPAATSTATSPTLPLYVYYTSFSADPDQGVVKEFDVQQTSSPQTITYTASGSTTPVTVTVPALPPPTVTVPIPSGLPLGCYDGLVTSKDANGNAVQEYFYIICSNPPQS